MRSVEAATTSPLYTPAHEPGRFSRSPTEPNASIAANSSPVDAPRINPTPITESRAVTITVGDKPAPPGWAPSLSDMATMAMLLSGSGPLDGPQPTGVIGFVVKAVRDTFKAGVDIYSPGGLLNRFADKVVDRAQGIEKPDEAYMSKAESGKYLKAIIDFGGALFPGAELKFNLPGGPTLVTANGHVVAGAATVVKTGIPQGTGILAAQVGDTMGSTKTTQENISHRGGPEKPEVTRENQPVTGEWKEGDPIPAGLSRGEMREPLSLARDFPGGIPGNNKQPGVDILVPGDPAKFTEKWTVAETASGAKTVTHETTGGIWVQIKGLLAGDTSIETRIDRNIDKAMEKFDGPVTGGESKAANRLTDGVTVIEKWTLPDKLHISLEVPGLEQMPLARQRALQEHAQESLNRHLGAFGARPGTFENVPTTIRIVPAP